MAGKLPTHIEDQIHAHLAFLYGTDAAGELTRRLTRRLSRFREEYPQIYQPEEGGRVSQEDAILITYGDMLNEPGKPPLQTLADFLETHLADSLSGVHILPFYPYSSDDGFSVIDYYAVNPELGSWADIARIGQRFKLMFDAVVNHISVRSTWFQGFLADDPRYRDYFIVVDPQTDLSGVFRPRSSPLLTPFDTAAGRKWVWTTFSADQVDLNYHNPEVLLDVLDVLLHYVAHGARFIRLDAIAYLWKEIGTPCINLPQTHRIIQLMRTVLDAVAPQVVLITETNVPHHENISYFGNGTNEAQMVYNFALPLLTLHAFHQGDVSILSQWASTLDLPSGRATFFNFLACHDGIGMLPVKNILDQAALDVIGKRTRELGGDISYKRNQDGSESPYELNINYLDALRLPDSPPLNPVEEASRFLATQAIMLALRGVPGIYFHSLVGSRNWLEGVRLTGHKRTINREKLARSVLEAELADENSLRYHVFKGYLHLIRQRKAHLAFHPYAGQRIIMANRAVFSVLRTSPDASEHILCLHNASPAPQDLSLNAQTLGVPLPAAVHDLVSGESWPVTGDALALRLKPYQVAWLCFG